MGIAAVSFDLAEVSVEGEAVKRRKKAVRRAVGRAVEGRGKAQLVGRDLAEVSVEGEDRPWKGRPAFSWNSR